MPGSRSEQLASSLRQAKEGDREALGRLLDRYRGYLSLLARIQIGHRLQSKTDPQDVVQEAYIEALRCFPQFEGERLDSFLPWLRKILAGKLAHLVRG